VFLSLPATLVAEPQWQFNSESDGVKVYRKDIPGSPFVGFKGVKVVPANIYKVGEILLDEDPVVKKRWIDRMTDFRMIERKSPTLGITYSAYDLPWPLEDRDYVIESELVIDNANNQIVLKLKSVEHPKSPKTVGVRAVIMHSMYKLVPLPNGQTEVSVEILTDPKGDLPPWLVNLIQRGWPANTLVRLEAEAIKPGTKESPMLKRDFKGRQLAARE
jgi:hypothetical protein